jgi:hypothetical protein
MMPLVPVRFRLASPLVLLLLVGGAIAAGEYWLRRQLPEKPATRRKPAPAARKRRAPVTRRRRSRGSPAVAPA